MKNLFIRTLSLAVCMIILLGSFLSVTLNVSAEEDMDLEYSDFGARGVWHRPNSSGKETTLEGLCSVLDEMADSGINMIFLETFYHGMSVFKSNLIPYYKGFEKFDYGDYPDYLTAFASEAEKRGIEVHAWVETFYVGINDDATLVKYHPDWMLINESGKTRHTTEGASVGGYLFFDPANPDVRSYLLRYYEEILKKVPSVKGLNLDYIRYPVSDFYSGTDTGYTEISMRGFAEKYGFSLSESDTIRDFKAKINSKSLVNQWIEYRSEFITEFVGSVSEMVREEHPECIVSVAVHPDINGAYTQKKQNFLEWVEKGYIDVVTPMVYYYTSSQISSALKTMLTKFDSVYCYSGLYTTYHDQSVKELEDHIAASDGCGADGFVLFDSAKTFFNSSHDYKGLLSDKYGAASGLFALPHWSTDKLIGAAADILEKHLSESGEDTETVQRAVSEMVRISQIGEGSAESIELTVNELSSLKQDLATILKEDSLPEAVRILNLLEDYLKVRASRLSFKGYPEADLPDDDGDNGESDGGGKDENPGASDNAPMSFFEIIANIINEIINWFKNLFK